MDRLSTLLPPLPPEPDYAAIRVRLQATLSAADWDDVQTLLLQEESHTAAYCWGAMHATIEAIAAHFPGLAPRSAPWRTTSIPRCPTTPARTSARTPGRSADRSATRPSSWRRARRPRSRPA